MQMSLPANQGRAWQNKTMEEVTLDLAVNNFSCVVNDVGIPDGRECIPDGQE